MNGLEAMIAFGKRCDGASVVTTISFPGFGRDPFSRSPPGRFVPAAAHLGGKRFTSVSSRRRKDFMRDFVDTGSRRNRARPRGGPFLNSRIGEAIHPAMDSETVIRTLRAHEEELRAEGISHVFLFGSVARGEADEHSDVDLFFDYHDPKFSLID